MSERLHAGQGGDGKPSIARAMEVLHRVAEPKPLSPQTVAAIGERLRVARERQSRGLRLGAKLALATAIFLVVNAGFAAADWGHLWKRVTASLAETVRRKPRSEPPPPRPPALDSTESPPTPGPATVEAPSFNVPSPSLPELPAPSVHVRPKSNVQSTSKREDDREELGLFSRARATRDPTTCLGLLDEYAERFPRGVFRVEAELIRLDALLRAGRSADALRLLDRWQQGEFAELARPRELSVLRRELLAGEGRCAEALAGDVDTGGDSALDERWLYLRGVCHGRSGAVSTARQEFQEYLRKYPQGRFVSEVRRAMGP
jgi:hypothetical protein